MINLSDGELYESSEFDAKAFEEGFSSGYTVGFDEGLEEGR